MTQDQINDIKHAARELNISLKLAKRWYLFNHELYAQLKKYKNDGYKWENNFHTIDGYEIMISVVNGTYLQSEIKKDGIDYMSIYLGGENDPPFDKIFVASTLVFLTFTNQFKEL
jgi:hypothetical protein